MKTSQSSVPIVGLPLLSALENKSSSNLKALTMSLGVAPHAAELKKRSVPTVETTATVPSGECFPFYKSTWLVYHWNKDYTI